MTARDERATTSEVELLSIFDELVSSGEAEAIERDGKTVYVLSPNKIRQIKEDYGKVSKFTLKIINEITVEKNKRSYRKRKEGQIPDPTKSHRAEVNRTDFLISGRVSARHRDLFKLCAESFKTNGLTLERAIELLATERGIPFESDQDEKNTAEPR